MTPRFLLFSILLWPLALASAGACAAQVSNETQLSNSRSFFVSESMLGARDFPFFAALLEDAEISHVLASDPNLHQLTQQRLSSISSAGHDCGNDVACKSAAFRFTAEQIEQICVALDRLYRESETVRGFVHTRLIPKDAYTQNPGDSEQHIFVQSWKNAAQAMNRIIAIYCDGNTPHYRNIDSMSFTPGSPSFASLLVVLIDGLDAEDAGTQPSPTPKIFFEPSLRFCVRLLGANLRDEAGRFWPLDSGENAAAIRRNAGIDWKQYRYSVILIPGEGPESYDIPLSALGKERLRLAVAAWRSGLAPYFLLSGGFVHPSQTPFCEAVEMKKYLELVYGVPEEVILIDPQARHTTTNLRNGARQIFDYHLPDDRPMLVVSDSFQTSYIAGKAFQQRNLDELGYMPVTIGRRLSETQLEATPLRRSEFRDAMDPLDP
jgi:hypothetical protein